MLFDLLSVSVLLIIIGTYSSGTGFYIQPKYPKIIFWDSNIFFECRYCFMKSALSVFLLNFAKQCITIKRIVYNLRYNVITITVFILKCVICLKNFKSLPSFTVNYCCRCHSLSCCDPAELLHTSQVYPVQLHIHIQNSPLKVRIMFMKIAT